MDLGLRGKVALVTAASKGLGKASATGLSAEGARVAICARTQADLDAAAREIRAKTGGEVLGVPCDVTRPAEVDALMDAAQVASLGQITRRLYEIGGRYRRNM